MKQRLSAWESEGTITVVFILYGDGDFPGKGGTLEEGTSCYGNSFVESIENWFYKENYGLFFFSSSL